MTSKITLFAMTKKGCEVLRAIAAEHRDLISAVVGARDRDVLDDHYDEIRTMAADIGVPFFDRRERPAVTTSYVVAVSWRWMLDLPSCTVIVLHDSILPAYRGFAPLVSALVNGESRVGVTALIANDQFDSGPIIDQVIRTIEYPIRIGDVIEQLSGTYRDLALSIVGRLSRGEQLRGTAQDESRATYSLWRDGEDYQIDWSQSSSRIRRFIDAVGPPYRGAFSTVNRTPSRVLDAQEERDVVIMNRTPGKVMFIRDGEPIVVCGSGLLRIRALVDERTGKSLLPLAALRTRFA